MGIWGDGLFENDAASAAKAIFEVALADGASVAQATKQVLDELKAMAEDEGVFSVIVLALAALQLESKQLQPDIKAQALEIITVGKGLKHWEELGSVNLEQRKSTLEKFKQMLQNA
ncbi:MAG: hypothetical protein ACK4XY_10560 [Chloroherpetonaceae bacterium]